MEILLHVDSEYLKQVQQWFFTVSINQYQALLDSKLTHTTSHSFEYSQKEMNLDDVVLNTHNTNLVIFIF